MKISGKKYDEPNEVTVVIPRSDTDLIFKARAVLSYDEFMETCPQPVPPTIMRPGKAAYKNFEDANYKKDIDDWAEKKTAWMFLKSLSATADLEWETVDMNDPDTWKNYLSEINESFTDLEAIRIMKAVHQANGIDQTTIDQALESFLASQAGPNLGK